MRPNMRPMALVLLAFGLALAASQASAATKLRHHRPHRHVAAYVDNRPPLTVNKRSWLDPGPAAPVGSEQNYVAESTYFQQTPDQAVFPSRFREDAMPRPLYVPGGNMTPLVTFATPRDPFGP